MSGINERILNSQGQKRSKRKLQPGEEKSKINIWSKMVKVDDDIKTADREKCMGVSDIIARFINDMIGDMGGTAELQRAELATRFKCVPSQINYVISTRFSPEHGYIVESRRGGGGYIRIKRVAMGSEMLIMHTVNAIGDRVDANTAAALINNLCQSDALNNEDTRLIFSAIGANALRPARPIDRDALRASILKQMLIHLKK